MHNRPFLGLTSALIKADGDTLGTSVTICCLARITSEVPLTQVCCTPNVNTSHQKSPYTGLYPFLKYSHFTIAKSDLLGFGPPSSRGTVVRLWVLSHRHVEDSIVMAGWSPELIGSTSDCPIPLAWASLPTPEVPPRRVLPAPVSWTSCSGRPLAVPDSLLSRTLSV